MTSSVSVSTQCKEIIEIYIYYTKYNFVCTTFTFLFVVDLQSASQ